MKFKYQLLPIKGESSVILQILIIVGMLLLSSSHSNAKTIDESVFSFHSAIILDNNLQPYKEEKINGLISIVENEGKKVCNSERGRCHY